MPSPLRSSDAKVVFDLMVMDEAGKAQAEELLNRLQVVLQHPARAL